MAIFTGSVFDDTLFGTLLDDQIDGLDGNDYLFGNDGNDTMLGFTGNDALDGWNGNDLLAGEDGDDLLMGHVGNDTLDGGNGNDALYGEADDDYMIGSTGNDIMDGGDGLDVVDYSFLGTAISLEAQGIINKGTAGVDQSASVETIIGATGYNNLIDGSTGDSTEVFFTIDLEANSLVVNNIPFIGTQTFSVENFVNVIGTTQADNIVGNSLNNIIDGSGGNDFIEASSGNDTIDGGAGDDELFGEEGDDLILGFTGSDVISGGSGSDTLLGESGNDFLFGYGFTTAEYDLLSGGTGADAFFLGDSFGAYYEGFGYATITDFNSLEGDLIALAGTESSYSLGVQNFSGTNDLDTLIYYNSDLIGVLEDTTNVNTAFDFIYI